MKITLLYFVLFFTTLGWSQTITGIVRDSKTNKPLPFASIEPNTGSGTITDYNGHFELEGQNTTTNIRVSYIGYAPMEVQITSDKTFYPISLEQATVELDEVILNSYVRSAEDIIRNAIAYKRNNNPEKILDSYSFKTYHKLLVTAPIDSINPAIDSIFVRDNGKLNFKELDSTNFNLQKQLLRSHLYISEKASSFKYTKNKGRQETVNAIRMAGFKEPIYEVLGLQFQSFSFYDPDYILLENEYINPLSSAGLKHYKYKILDVTKKGSSSAFMVYYSPKEHHPTQNLEGVLYINTTTFALQKAIAQTTGVFEVKATQTFSYYPNENIWFPHGKEIKIKKGDTPESLSFLGNRFELRKGQKDSTLVHSNPQNAEDLVYLISKEHNFEIALNEPIKIKRRGLAVTIEEDAYEKKEAFWKSFRTDTISPLGQETYVYMDSLVDQKKIEPRLNRTRKLLQGYYPTKYFDFDLRYLLKYNNYEAFRLGLGAITNTNFSNTIFLNGYAVYGTLDKKFKYSFGATTRLNKEYNTWLGVNYTDDLVESGSSKYITDKRTFYLFEPRLFNISSFYATKSTAVFLEHDFTSKFNSRIQFSKSFIDPTYNYAYLLDGESYDTYDLTEATWSFQWNPFSKYMQAPEEKRTLKDGFPQFTLQLSQSIPNVMDGDFNFTKINFKAFYVKRFLNKTRTEILFNSGLAFGDIPLTHLYHASPNQPDGSVIMDRFSVTGRESFETMFFDEFFSDRFIMGQIRHTLRPFKINNRIKPQLALITRSVIGDVSNIENHQGLNFGSLNKGYFESGVELNRILAGFGLSFFYRHGAYHLPTFDDNISFKFTYYFGSGF
ncbi:DUF5686 and carboxypeptidase-like regulatory domain-containing protein [Sediminicola sp. 1XM1-17]|uniref:DUF5686 and carboxypeptidase-like regulatory domain-containing protein n=1 Tax=Sediminicola sp. 1XM1-17 TaxID=3127702 RepID=UPI0030783DEE